MKHIPPRAVSCLRLAAAAALATTTIPIHAGVFETDFSQDPFSAALPPQQRLTIFSNQSATSPNRPSWVAAGGVDNSGYLKLTDAVGSIRSTIVFPDFEPGFHVAGFNFGVDCRLGGGGLDPADGFSINFARTSTVGGVVDPVINTGAGYAGTNNVGHTEADRHEEGTQTGLGIGFDAYFSGGEDKIGISVRVDNQLLTQVELPLKNLATTDANYASSLQTGPRLSDPATAQERIDALSWARFEVALNPDTGLLNIAWKGQNVVQNLDIGFSPGPGRLVFGARTGGQNQVHHFDNLTLETFPVKLATVTSAKVSHAGYVFQITDYEDDDVQSIVTPADIDSFTIANVDVTPTSVTKTGNVTTITYVPPSPLPPYTARDYSVVATDQNAQEVRADGAVITPILPAAFYITDAPVLNQWNIRELRGGTVASTGNPPAVINSAHAIAANPPGTVSNYTAPYFNLTDDNNFGDRGFFKRDSLYATNTGTPAATVDDHNMVGLGRTKVQITEAGDYTFWVRSDDGFALRVNGGTFHKVSGIAGTQIDASDASTFAFLNGTGNPDARGVIHLEPGEHVIDFLWFEGTGGSYSEVSWAAGDHAAASNTGRWKLVGGANDTPFFPAGPLAEPALPTGSGWAVRNYYNGGDVLTLRAAFERIANPGSSLVANATSPIVNFRDPNNAGADGFFTNNLPFPLEAAVAPAVDDNQFVTVARHQFHADQAGNYTFAVTSDDGFAFRMLGGPYLVNHNAPLNNSGGADPLDSTAFVNSAANGTASFGVYRVDAPGDYVIELVQVEQTGGASAEVAWAFGNFTSRNATGSWKLVGDLADPGVPALVPVVPSDIFAALPNDSAEESASWSVSFVYPNPTSTVGSLTAAFAVASNANSTRTNGFVPYLNHLNRSVLNPGTGTHGLFHSSRTDQYNLAELYFLGAGLTAVIEDMMVLAKARITIPTTGLYTFGVNADDGFALRIPGAPNGFRRVSGTAETVIDMAQPNTVYRSGGTASNRMVIELPAGDHDIEFVFYERGGTAGFELFSAPGDITNEADSTAWRAVGHASSGGLALARQTVPVPDGPVIVSDFTFDPVAGTFGFSWNSAQSVSYLIEYSSDLVTWHTLEAGYPGEETSTSYEGNIADLTELESTDKVFFRLEVPE